MSVSQGVFCKLPKNIHSVVELLVWFKATVRSQRSLGKIYSNVLSFAASYLKSQCEFDICRLGFLCVDGGGHAKTLSLDIAWGRLPRSHLCCWWCKIEWICLLFFPPTLFSSFSPPLLLVLALLPFLCCTMLTSQRESVLQSLHFSNLKKSSSTVLHRERCPDIAFLFLRNSLLHLPCTTDFQMETM